MVLGARCRRQRIKNFGSKSQSERVSESPSAGAAAPVANGFDGLAHGGRRRSPRQPAGAGAVNFAKKESPARVRRSRTKGQINSEICRARVGARESMRSSKPGAVNIDPVSARRRRRRPPPRPASPAIAIAKNRIGDPAAPAARAGRTAPCSPSELTTRPASRARRFPASMVNGGRRFRSA
jgi:hypothetical protein